MSKFLSAEVGFSFATATLGLLLLRKELNEHRSYFQHEDLTPRESEHERPLVSSRRPTKCTLHMQQDAGNVMPGSRGVIWLGAYQRQTHRLHKEGLVL